MIYVGNKRYSLYVGDKRREMIIPESLPYDAEIEYLESSGSQKINAGITLQAGDYPTYIIECELLQKNARYESIPIGYYIGQASNIACITFYRKNYNLAFNFGVREDTMDTYADYALNTRYKIIANSPTGSYVDGTLVGTRYISMIQNSNQPIYIFVNNANGNISAEYFIGRIYSCQIKINGIVVRDFIPVRIGQTGYMYDKISGQLFGNEGTGDFALGPDKLPSILPSGYTQILGVKNTSTAYLPAPTINAGVRYELEIEATNGFSNGLFSYNSTGSYEIIVFLNGSSDSYLNGEFTLEGFSLNTKFKIVLDLAMESEYARLYINDELVRQTALHVNIGSDIGIFKDLRRNTYVKGILYSFRGYKDDVLINDYIPAIRNSDGKVGVYDIASNEFVLSPNDVDFEAVLQ